MKLQQQGEAAFQVVDLRLVRVGAGAVAQRRARLDKGGPLRQLAGASPAYLAKHGTLVHPEDLHRHTCINWRQDGSPTLYHWEFEKDGQQLTVAVKGSLILNDRELAVAAAVQGLGVAFWAEHRLRPFLVSGELVALLEEWSPTFPGFFAYYRKQRFMTHSLRGLLDILRGKQER